MAELVAVLVDETMTVAAGGTVYDDKGKVIKLYEARLPAVLDFEVPPGCASFTLEVAGQKFTQPLPEDHGDEDEHEEPPRAAPPGEGGVRSDGAARTQARAPALAHGQGRGTFPACCW